LSGGPLRSFASSGPISGLALDLVAVLASLEGLVVVGVPGGHEGLDESGHGGDVLSHTAELANNLLHAFLAAQDGRVHVLNTLGKVDHWVRLFGQGPLLPLNIHNSGEEKREANDGQDDSNEGEDAGSEVGLLGAVGGSGVVGLGGSVIAIGGSTVTGVGSAVAGVRGAIGIGGSAVASGWGGSTVAGGGCTVARGGSGGGRVAVAVGAVALGDLGGLSVSCAGHSKAQHGCLFEEHSVCVGLVVLCAKYISP